MTSPKKKPLQTDLLLFSLLLVSEIEPVPSVSEDSEDKSVPALVALRRVFIFTHTYCLGMLNSITERD